MSATRVDANRAVMNAIPSGASILPSIPVRKNRGTKLTIIISVELRMGMRTSFDASKITVSAGRCSCMGKFRLCRNRL